jgi:hypothetical protein
LFAYRVTFLCGSFQTDEIYPAVSAPSLPFTKVMTHRNEFLIALDGILEYYFKITLIFYLVGLIEVEVMHIFIQRAR